MDGGGETGACAPVVSTIASLPGFSGLATEGLSSEQGLASTSDLLLESSKSGKVGSNCSFDCSSWRVLMGQFRDTPSTLFDMQARKPYTISKARERWSDEEHQRFVEAVRLHGRAWRKIEGEVAAQHRMGTQHGYTASTARHSPASHAHLPFADFSSCYCCLQSTLAPRQQCRYAAMHRSSSTSWRRKRRRASSLTKVGTSQCS